MQHGRNLLCWSVSAFAAALLVSGTAFAASFGSGAQELAAPDTVRIDVIAVHKPLEMAPAVFPHGKHVEKMAKNGKDCTVCHKELSGEAPFAFNQLTSSLKADALESGFHNACLDCHQDMGGPGSVECRECHNAKVPAASAALPVKFNKSLHAAHVSSELIKAPEGAPAGSDNCGACHHVFDKKANAAVWAKGQEDACASCHGRVEDAPALKDASHAACVTCHLNVLASKQEAKAPVACESCHSADGQKAFPVMAELPRLMRGQPDATLIMPPLAENEKPGMTPVVFNHKAHEAAVDSCTTCHHVRIDKTCAECHTLNGSEDGKFVQLGDAMHSGSLQSCVGCHTDMVKTDKNCAGCHGNLKVRRDASCNVCHAPLDGAFEELAKADKKALQQYAAARLNGVSAVAPTASADIPETVTIGMLAADFEPSVFPHRKVYEALVKGVEGKALAARFHTTPETLCAACHHNVPFADLKQPPKCATCHSARQDKMAVDTNMPSLKAAYHQQCVACHTNMDVKPVAQDCEGCHAKAAH